MSCRQIKLIKEQEETILDLQGQLDLAQGCTNPRYKVAWLTKLCTVMSHVCGSSAWNFPHTYIFDVGHRFLEQFCTHALAYSQNNNVNKNSARCNSMQIFIYCKVTLHVSGVTAPIIMSTKNCNCIFLMMGAMTTETCRVTLQ